MANQIEIEIVYALPGNQLLKRVKVPNGTTAEQAIAISCVTSIFPEISLTKNKLGIFGKSIKPEMILHPHDRLEIYRPLIIDPKEARRKRARI
ncbi:MAG: RnfH family protein [Nitrosomonas sp.]|nr:RnfH family protein [Nitrosomonas sp.]MDP1950551.1 RnfH family protein [Nitrosomonas sp.]